MHVHVHVCVHVCVCMSRCVRHVYMPCGCATHIHIRKPLAEVTLDQVHSTRTLTLFSYTDETRSRYWVFITSRSIKETTAGLASSLQIDTLMHICMYCMVSLFSHD